MERREFQTSLGTVVLSGDFDGDRPIVVVIRGAYADPDMFAQLPAVLPDVRVLFGDIPGNRCPLLSEQSVDAYCVAYSETIGRLAGPAIVCGLSLGGVIALGLTCPRSAVVAIDPPLRPAESVVLQKVMRAAFKKSADPIDRDFVKGVFLSGDDYTPLLSRLNGPAVVLAGDHVGTIPSVIADVTLAEIADNPWVETTRVRGVGHSVWVGGSSQIIEALRVLLTKQHKQQSASGTSTRS